MEPIAPQLNARIGGLFVYPIKSCAGAALTSATVFETGLDLDRAWMLVDDEGEFVSQRELPRMALIQPRIRTNDVVLRAPGMLALHVSIDEVEAPVRVRVWNDEVAAFDMGRIAAQWFSDFLGQRVRLVRFDPECRRLSDTRWTGSLESPNQFSDGFPFLVLSTDSLAELNGRLHAAGHAPVGIERFRPNVVIEGVEAHDEDRVDALNVRTAEGLEARLQLVKPCARCSIPDIDPSNARVGSAVSAALASYRADARVGGALTFGMNAVLVSGEGAVLRVGDPVVGNWQF